MRPRENFPQPGCAVAGFAKGSAAIDLGVSTVDFAEFRQAIRGDLADGGDALVGELPVGRIEPAVLQESRRLLRAPAGFASFTSPHFSFMNW